MIRLGIAGIGTIAKDYIDIIASGMVADAELTALSSRNAAHMAQVQAQYPALAGVKCFTSYDELLRSGVVDAVLICTPHGLHPSMALQAMEAGLHVLMEKPVGIFAGEVEQALQALEQRPGLVCGVLYNRRMSPTFRHVKEQLDSGAIGELVRATWLITNLYRTAAYYQTGSWRGSWQGEGGGLLMTQASHQLDLLQWLCGMPSAVWARCSTVGRDIVTENEAELFLTFPNGAHGHFIASAHESPGTNLLELCGTHGRLTVRDDSTVEWFRLEEDERRFARQCPSPFQQVPGAGSVQTFPGADNRSQQAACIQNFVHAAMGRARIQCPLADGLRSLQIIHGAYLSHWDRREVALPPDEEQFNAMLARQG